MKLISKEDAGWTGRAATMFIVFWGILIDEQIFFSPQVKRSVIISNKHGIFELPHELPDDYGIFAAGGDLCAHARKKKTLEIRMPTALLPLGGLTCPHKQKNKKT